MKRKGKREGRMKIIVGIIVAIFLISSIAAVVLYNNNDAASADDRFSITLSNGNYDFSRRQDASGNIYYEISSPRAFFTAFYLPQQIPTEGMNQEALEYLMKAQYFYLAFDPEDPGVGFADYLRFDLSKQIPADRYFLEGITKNSTVYFNLSIVSCKNASSQTPVVMLKSSNTTTNITLERDCVNIDFAEQDLIRIRDALLYSFQGIKIGQ